MSLLLTDTKLNVLKTAFRRKKKKKRKKGRSCLQQEVSSWSFASRYFSSKISPSRHAFSPSPLPHKAQGTNIWPFYLRSHKTFTLQLHTPVLTAGLCAHLQVRNAFNNSELCSQGYNSPIKGGEESSITHGWLSVH